MTNAELRQSMPGVCALVAELRDAFDADTSRLTVTYAKEGGHEWGCIDRRVGVPAYIGPTARSLRAPTGRA